MHEESRQHHRSTRHLPDDAPTPVGAPAGRHAPAQRTCAIAAEASQAPRARNTWRILALLALAALGTSTQPSLVLLAQQAAAWQLVQSEKIGPEAISEGKEFLAWTVSELKPGTIKATIVNSYAGNYESSLSVSFSPMPDGAVQYGAKVPLKIHAELKLGIPAGEDPAKFKHGDTVRLHFAVTAGERARVRPSEEGLTLDRENATGDWTGELEFTAPRDSSEEQTVVLWCEWHASDKWIAFWQGGYRWHYKAGAPPFSVTASPTFSGPATSAVVRLSSAADMQGATVDFGPGITQIGTPTATFGTAPNSFDLACIVQIAPDAALGPRTVRITLPNGKVGQASFSVHPLVIILDVDGMRWDILLDSIRGNKAPNLARLLGEQTSQGDVGGGSLNRREFEHGIYLLDTATVFPSYTFATQASIFTGVEPGVHGVTGNVMFDRTGTMKGGVPAIYGFDRNAEDAIGTYYVSALADRSLRADTIYQAMAGKAGVGKSGVFYNQYANGVAPEDRKVANPGELVAYIPALTTGLYDSGMASAGLSWLESFKGKPPEEWPSIATFYFAGVDHIGHEVNDTEEAKQSDYLSRYVDPEIGHLLSFVLTNCPGAVFILTADHGQTDVREGKPIGRDILYPAVGRFLDNATRTSDLMKLFTSVDASDFAIAQNGGLAHIHFRAAKDGRLLSWQDPPPYHQALSVAARLQELNRRQIPALGPGPYFDLILVKNAEANGWDSAYQVYTGDGKTEEIGAYLRRTNNDFGARLGWRRTEADIAFLAERLTAFSCDRSGDLVLVPRYPQFYMEDGPVQGEHGSLSTKDMTIPFMVAQWQAFDASLLLKVLQQTVENPSRPRVTDVVSTVAGFLGQSFRGRKHPLAGGGGATTGPTAPPVDTGTGPAAIDSGVRPLMLDTVDAITHQQISAFTDRFLVGSGIYPRVSRNGARTALSFEPDKADPQKKPRVAVVGADGTGFRVVDTYQPLTYAGLLVDISGDGTHVASTDNRQIRLAHADGGEAMKLVELTGNSIVCLRVSSNGSRVYFLVDSDTTLARAGTRIGRGVWMVDATGAGLRQIVGLADVARVTGLAPADIRWFRSPSRGWALDLSGDDKRLVFIAQALDTEFALVVNADGANLRKVLSATQYVLAVGISGDGTKVGVVCTNKGASGYQGWVVSSDGEGARKLTDKAADSGVVSLTRDGRYVIFGNEAVLHSTDGKGSLPIAPGARASSTARLTGGAKLSACVIADSPNQILWVAGDDNGLDQLVGTSLNPSATAPKLRITDIHVDRTDLPADGQTGATITARVQADGAAVSGIALAAYRDGVFDASVGSAAYLVDGGSGGDKTAGDGIYTSNNLSASTSAAAGPRSLRLIVEVKGSDGRRYAASIRAGTIRIGPPPR